MRTASGVTYLYGDHLGSTSVTADGSGTQTARQTYYAYGTVRTTEGMLPTDYTFTGQKLDASAGLMYYGARYFDAAIGRFAQPDSIVPNPYNPQSLNRYSYTLNNPVRYTDPSGHCVQVDNDPDGLCVLTDDEGDLTQIVHGGSEFVNPVEVGLANFLLTGNEGWLGAVPSVNPAFLDETFHAVASNLGFETPTNGQVPPDVLAVLAAAAVVSRGDKTDNNSLGVLRPSMNGNPDHQAGVAAAREYLDEMYNKSDFVIWSNKSIENALGIDRRPDWSVMRIVDREIVHIVEVARTTPGGSWVSREAAKMVQYIQAGLNFTFWKVP